jgi:CHAD domain-containing protein
MLAHVTAFVETRDPGELHHFRLQVKKMKAILGYLQNIRRDAFHYGGLVCLQSCYKHAGQIRAAQITLGLLEHDAVTDPAYRRELETIEKKETDQFCAKGKAYVRCVKKITKSLSLEFQDIEDKSIEILYQKQLKKLSRFFSRSILGDEALHKVRRRIKNLLYLYKMLPQKMISKLKWNIIYLDQLQHTIGEYHDVIQLISFLQEKEAADGKMLTDIRREKSQLFRTIRSLSSGFRKKVLG